jgi:hypothetical protein
VRWLEAALVPIAQTPRAATGRTVLYFDNGAQICEHCFQYNLEVLSHSREVLSHSREVLSHSREVLSHSREVLSHSGLL